MTVPDPSSTRRLIIVHDVLGTLFSLSAPIRALQEHYPHLCTPELAPFAQRIIFDWYHAAQRDHAGLSVNGAYRPFADVFRASLRRALAQAGLEPLVDVKSGTDEDPYAPLTKAVMESLQSLEPRPGMVQAFSHTYRDAALVPPAVRSVEIWGATNGSLALTRSLLHKALGQEAGGELKQEATSASAYGAGVGVFSTDEPKAAKPHPDAYAAVLKRLEAEKPSDGGEQSLWFVASHTWDLFAAKRAGFKTAWVSYEEHHPLTDLFGKPDVVAADLEEAARAILHWEGSGSSV